MAISDKSRKTLWAKSGNRCAICKVELFTKENILSEFSIGEECHIVSSKQNGPRHNSDKQDYDTHQNLILLCRNHHKQIDELYETYSEEILKNIKKNHENWLTETLTKSIKGSEENEITFLRKISSGKELLSLVSNCHARRMDYEDITNEEESEFIGSTLQEIFDYGEISDDVEVYDRVKMAFQLNSILKNLEEKGYFVFGERKSEPILNNSKNSDKWMVATIVIRQKNNPDILKLNLNKL